MSFDLHIKNIGKLNDAKLRIGRFTVLAGPNNTGKSFVSKILYSVFNAMNENPVEVQMQRLTAPVRENFLFRRFLPRENTNEIMDKDDTNSPFDDLERKIHEMEVSAKKQSFDDLAEIDGFLTTVNNMAQTLPEILSEIRSSLQQRSSRMSKFARRRTEDHFAELEESLDNLQKSLAGKTAQQFIVAGIHHMVERNLIRNFQISNLAGLRGKEGQASKISSAGIVEFDLVNGGIEFTAPPAGLQTLQEYSKVIYLESPVYWRLKSALEDMRLSDRSWRHARRERLSGVPEYFYDLASRLRADYTGEMDFPELHAKLTGGNVLGGKLVISDTGEILFRENDRSFMLSLTATGVVNLGILALLIERKILDKESFIFIDEPEAHLHPAWQVIMAESLFELAKGGAHVVIATHSADILKWLEVHIKENPDDEELVALNQFSPDKIVAEDASFADKLAAIKQGLTQPFADLYMQGLKGL